MGTDAGWAAPTPYKDLLAKRASPKRYFADVHEIRMLEISFGN